MDKASLLYYFMSDLETCYSSERELNHSETSPLHKLGVSFPEAFTLGSEKLPGENFKPKENCR